MDFYTMSAPETSAYILATQDTANLPNSRTISAGSGIAIEDTGPGGAITVSVSQTVAALENLSDGATGYLVKTGANTINTASITSSSNTITVTNGSGVAGDTNIDVAPDTTVQKTIVSLNGVTQATRPQLNFIPGANAGVTVVDNPTNNSVDITISGDTGSYAPIDETFITQTPSSALTNGQALSLLSTGLVKVTTGTGVLSAAEPGIDYLAPNAALNSLANLTVSSGQLLVGNSSNGFSGLAVGTNGQILSIVGGVPAWANSAIDLSSHYVLQVPDANLPNSQALSALSTGLVKVTTGTGVLSNAVAGTDYLAPSAAFTALGNLSAPNAGDLVVCNTSGIYNNLAIGSAGQVLTSNGTTASWASPAGGGAPTTSKYILQEADANLPNAQVLSGLSSGVVAVTNGTGALSSLGIGANGQALISNGTTAVWGSPVAGPIPQYVATLTGSGMGAVPQSIYILTTASGPAGCTLQIDSPTQPDGSWMYIQVTPGSTENLIIYASLTEVGTVSNTDNTLHFYMKLNGVWTKIY